MSVAVPSKFGLKPLTKQNVLYYYFPMQGVFSHTALAVNVMNPALLANLFPRRDITNILLINTLVGSGLYISSRALLNKASKQEKVLYSILGASLYTFGSVLLMAIARNVLPKCGPFVMLVGAGGSLLITKISYDYLTFVDNNVRS